MYGCLFLSLAEGETPEVQRLLDIARTCSPRVSLHGPHAVVLDVDGLTRLFGNAHAVAEQMAKAAAEGGCPQVRVAVAATQAAAILLASACPGLTVVEPGEEAAALAPLPVRVLEALGPVPQSPIPSPRSPALPQSPTPNPQSPTPNPQSPGSPRSPIPDPQSPVSTLSRWGIRTLGQLAALPPVALSERLGQDGVQWQRWARGLDDDPLVPTLDEEVFEAVLEPEWPIDDTGQLAVAVRELLGPLCERLARRDRAAAVLHIRLRLVTREVHARSLQLPAPMRDADSLHTIVMLALEANPAPAGIDVVSLLVDPTPGRVVQESLFTRAVPPPEQVATLMARLGALMGERRCGSPALVDSHRPGAFVMQPFSMELGHGAWGVARGNKAVPTTHDPRPTSQPLAPSVALRRFRLPVSARVVVEHGRPAMVRTDRQSLQGGVVRMCAGPWRTSGEWWQSPGRPPTELDKLRGRAGWHRDEWDVALIDGGIYRIFEDRDTGRWFMEGIVD